MNVKIGNWPGVTLEKKSGIVKGTSFEMVDLPGIYSLSPYSVEEEVSRDFIEKEKPDLIINVVDSTILERSLYLTTQLLEKNIKMILVLNMVDVLEKEGIELDEAMLSSVLGVKVMKVSALKGEGIQELMTEIKKNDFTRENKNGEEKRKQVLENINKAIQISRKKYLVDVEEATITR